MSDPFAFLRSLVPAIDPSASPVPSGTVDSAPAAPVESDLFAGSEPVPATPENTPAVAETVAPSVSDSGLVVPSASVQAIQAPASIPGDILTAMQAALIDLDTRLQPIEAYLRQNGIL